MSKIEVSEIQFKILHLLDNIPPENRTLSFISAKLKKHTNTVRSNIKLLVAIGLVNEGVSNTGSKHYFLVEKIRKNVNLYCGVGGGGE